MKICFVVGAFPTMKCGIGDYTSKLASELSNNGHDISIITSRKALKTLNNNIKIYNIVENWNFRNLRNILKTISEIQPDVVNIQYPSKEYKKNIMINILPFFIKTRIKCKLIETIHEFSIFTFLGKIRNYVSFIKADDIVVVEEEYIPMIKMLNKKKKLSYIPIASNIKTSEISVKEEMEIKEELNVGKNKLISYFGFVSESKGIEELFYAIQKIPEAKLLFIGELNKEDEYQKSLMDLAEKMDINDRIITTGFLEEEKVANYLKLSDVCVLPFKNGVSNRNGSFLAAYNQNIPIVTTTKKDSYEKDNVYYVNVNKKEEVVEKIKIALNNKETINRKIITWDEIAKKYIELMEE